MHRRIAKFLKALLFLAFPVSMVFLHAPAAAQNRPPLCDTTCAPDPGSSTYGGAVAARAKRQNARGSRSRSTAVIRPRAMTGAAPNATVVGSQSFNDVIPILTWPGRAGTDLSINLYYNSRIWDVDTVGSTVTFNADRDFPSYGFRLDFGYIEYDSVDDQYILTASDGTKLALVNTGSGYQSTDGSFIVYSPSAGNLIYNNGTTRHYVVFPSQASGTQTLFRPTQIKDANGNFISIAYVSGHDQLISAITDTVGRVINFNYSTMPDGSLRLASLTQNTTNPVGTQTYATFTWGTVTFNYSFTSSLAVNNSPASGSTINVLTGCTYSNGTGYSFIYGDWGIVNEIDHISSNGTIRSYTRYDYPLASAATLSDVPTYGHQTISPDGTTSNSSVWTYGVSKNGTGVVTSMTVTDLNGNQTTTNLDPNTGLPSSTQSSDNSNNLLRETDLTWTTLGTGAGASSVVQSSTTILKDSGQQAKVTYAYDSYGNATDVYEYDFDGTLKRHTVTTFQVDSGPHILSLPTKVLVEDSGGNVFARTDLAYDTTSLTGPTGQIVGHDGNFGAGLTTRGNLTSITRYSNAAAGTGVISRTFNYDIFGNVLVAQLDCCNQKTFNFSSATQYSEPDSVVRGPSGGTQFTTSYTYNPDNGLMLTSKDENGQTTSYSYDSMGRTIQVTLPPQNGTQVQLNTGYDDTDVSPTVTNSNTANSSVTVTTLDGLGHVMEVDNKNGGALVSSVKYVYDKDWQRTQVSNPFGPSDPIVYTTFSYDGLGRVTQVAPASAGYTGYYYSGNAVTTTDPAGKQRKNYTDALGRLIEVDEPGETFGGTQANGNTVVGGTLQNKLVGAQNPSQATGSVTIIGSEQCFTPPPPPTCNPPMPCCLVMPEPEWPFFDPPLELLLQTICDSGTVSITVNGHTNQVSYGSGSTSSAIASGLVSAINGDGGAFVSASASGATVYLTAKTAGPNYSLSSSYTYDNADFPGSPSFVTSNSGSALSGGSYGSNGTTVYDSGTVSITVGAFSSGNPTITGSEKSKLVSNRYCAEWSRNGACVDWEAETYTLYDSGNVTLTVNGHADSAGYGQGSNVNSVAASLAQAINADTGAFVNASAGANGVVNLTARQAGTTGNYSWSISSASDDPADFGSAGSFGANPTSGALSGGSANVFTANASYSQTGNSTAGQVASSLASALNASGSIVTATASGTNIKLIYKSVGVVGNVPATCSASTNQGAYFSSSSFSCSSISLSSGEDAYSTGLAHPYATTYTYDLMNNLTGVAQAAGNVNGQPVGGQGRSYTYDSLGRLLNSTTPESGTVTHYYTDANNNACAGDPSLACRVQDARGIVKTLTYDGINRISGATYSDGTPSVTYQYDTGGAAAFALTRLTKITEGANSQTFTYDNLGRISSVSQVIDGTTYPIQYGYNLASQLTSITYPTGRIVRENVDPIGRLSSLADGTATYLNNLSYNAAGQTLGLTLGNQVQGSFSYNDHLQIATLRYFKSGASSDILNLAYDYSTGVPGNNGQIQILHYYTSPGTEDLTKTENFTYDAWGRLSAASTTTVNSATPGTWSLQWAYDRLGNRLSQTLVGGSVSVGQPQLMIDRTTNRITSGGFQYDAAGNMINDSLSAYSFDAANRLQQINSGSASYTYFGPLRIKKVVGSTTTVYIYSGNKPIVEYVSGAASKEYIYAGSKLLATIAGGATTYHHPDHLSNRAETDVNGNVARAYGHFPFGETWYETGTADKWKFTSYERDSAAGESGLDYAQFRHYSSGLGRFMSADLMSGRLLTPQSLNRYSYVINDPVNLVDPRGLFYLICELLDNCPGDDPDPVLDGGDGGGGGGGLPGDPCNGGPCGDGGGGGGGGGESGTSKGPNVNIQALMDCLFNQFGILGLNFSPSLPGGTGDPKDNTNGSFSGLGFDMLGGSPSIPFLQENLITVNNDAQTYSSSYITNMAKEAGKVPQDSIAPVVGFTSQNNPYTNFTDNSRLDPASMIDTQIWELGNSLGIITGVQSDSPANWQDEAGKTLLDCYKNGGPNK